MRRHSRGLLRGEAVAGYGPRALDCGRGNLTILRPRTKQEMHGRRVITQLLLLFALLAGQQFALVHAVAHLPNGEVAGGKESGLPHGKVCPQCVLSSHLAHALTCTAPALATIASFSFETSPVRGSHFAAAILGFQSRAPPVAL